MPVRTAVLATAIVLSSCSHFASSGGPASALPAAPAAKQSPIKHIVILIQENRSFDNLFATYPGADGAMHGMMKSPDGSVKLVPLIKGGLVTYDVAHNHWTFEKEYDGGNVDGFALATASIHHVSRQIGQYNYRYVDPKEIAPYWAIAKQYVLADHMYPTQSSGSFTAHQDLIAGGTAINRWVSVIDDPSDSGADGGAWGCDAPSLTKTSLINSRRQYFRFAGPFPCFTWSTLADLLDRGGLTWKYYTPQLCCAGGAIWNAFDAIKAVRYSDAWKADVVSPPMEILRDARRGTLASVSWVVPQKNDSDHPGGVSDHGPQWVAQVVNAIGRGPHWNSTAIVVVWDDWGGLFDHERPPQIDYQGFGFRVPMLVISPYAKRGYVSHTQYEFGSILKFVENNWHLGTLGATDLRANSILDCFDFSQRPRKFVPIRAKLPESYFLGEPVSREPVDDE